MKYYRYLYTGEGIRDLTKTKKALNEHKGFLNLYVIVLNQVSGLLEIINANYLMLPYYSKHIPIVVGLARGYEEARALVVGIVEDSIQRTGQADIKEYLIRRVKNKDIFDND